MTTIFKELLINEQITANEVRVIDDSGEQLGIISLSDALAKAEEKELDLVQMAGASVPPVCRFMNYSKFKYDSIKKEKEIKKTQKVVETKEVRISMTIEEHDIAYKLKGAISFLKDGDKVKVALRMKGREQAYANKAIDIVNDFVSRLSEYGVADKKAERMGKNIFVVVSPKK